MPNATPSMLFHLRTMAGIYRDDARTDPELLERFAETHDETAFATLTVRHGPLVWRICRRILGNTQDAEDAYQVVFLALANKARKIHIDKSLVGWLQQVAHQTALNARKAARTRQKLQTNLAAKTPSHPVNDGSLERVDESREIHESLHSELAKLPEKLRVALVLYYLEGKTQAEVALVLGVKEPSVWSRLARGRALLEKRLRRHGLPICAATLEVLLAETGSHAAMPPGLAGKAVQAAMNFPEGKLTGGLELLARQVLRHAPATAPWWKTGWLITMLCLSGLGVGASGVVWKAGYFGTEKGESSALNAYSTSGVLKAKTSTAPRVDRFGDPLPPGALARLGTTRLRLTGRYGGLAFTPDSKQLLIYGINGSARICDAASGRVLRVFGQDVRAAAMSHDGCILACRSPEASDGLCMWDFKTGNLLQKIDAGKMDWQAALALSPDGKLVATASHSSEFGAWELANRNTLWAIGGRQGGTFLTYSSDSKHLYDVRPTEIHVIDAVTGRPLRRWGQKADYDIVGWTCSFNGRAAAIVYRQRPTKNIHDPQLTEIHVCEAETGKRMQRFSLQQISGVGPAIALSPDGAIIAVADDREGLIRVWDVKTAKERISYRCRYPIRLSQEGVSDALAFSPNGKVLAALNNHFQDHTVHLWDANSGREITPPCNGHRGPVLSLAFTKDGKEIVSGAHDGVFRAWDAASGAERSHWGRASDSCNGWARFMMGCFAANGRAAAILEAVPGNKDAEPTTFMRIVCRDGELGRELSRFPIALNADWWMNRHLISLSADNKLVAYSRVDSESVDLFDTSTGKMLRRFPGERMAFSPDGKIFAARLVSRENNGDVGIWSVRSGKKLCSIQRVINASPPFEWKDMVFSPDGRVLALTETNLGETSQSIRLCQLYGNAEEGVRVGAITLINIESAESKRTNPLRLGLPLAFSPDGRMLATSDKDDVIYVYETATRAERARLQGHEGEISCLAFSPDGKRLATGSSDGSILVWDVTGGRLNPSAQLVASKLTARDLQNLWKDLRGGQARISAQAVWVLASGGDPVVSFLANRLKPVSAQGIDRTKVARCISALDAERYAEREKARRELEAAGRAIESDLRRVLRQKISAQKRETVQKLLAAIDESRRKTALEGMSAEEIRSLRAIEALGHIGSPAAKRLLENLAAGMPTAPPTQAAQAILQKGSR